jgi:hypothetical protein
VLEQRGGDVREQQRELHPVLRENLSGSDGDGEAVAEYAQLLVHALVVPVGAGAFQNTQ